MDVLGPIRSITALNTSERHLNLPEYVFYYSSLKLSRYSIEKEYEPTRHTRPLLRDTL